MAEDRRKIFSARLVVAAAALLGLAAGAVAVYVSQSPSGNTGAEPAGAVVADADVKACTGKAEEAKALGEAATGEVAAMLAADPPQSLKALAFDLPDGTPATLADFSGKTVLVNLWATWCAPCRAEMPALDQLQQEMGSEEFEVVAVNVDAGSDDKPKKFLAETGVKNLAFYRDDTLTLFNDLKVRGLALGLPVTLLIDADGCLLAHMNGPAEWASGDAKAWVGKALH